jgi:hypothetical protein
MADRTDSEIRPEPAANLKAASISDAGTNSTPEISEPMLDVHAPHESIHTWKREQLLRVTAQIEGQIVSTRTLLLLTSIPLQTYLDRVDGTK